MSCGAITLVAAFGAGDATRGHASGADGDGRVRFDRVLAIVGWVPLAPDSDLLRLAGRELGLALARDAAFLAAIGASAGTGTRGPS